MLKKLLFWTAVVCAGFAAAFAVCRLNGEPFGVYLWPLIVCVCGFVLSAAGFFHTEGKSEALYGVCSAACLFCAIVQTAMMF